jgi:hypothetical protein
MNIKASGRSALIIAAGFWICVSGPLQAAEDADGGIAAYKTEPAAGPPVALNKFAKKSRHWKRASSQRKSVTVVARDSTEPAKTSEKKISEKKKTLEADAALNDDSSALPPTVANANAQLASADAPADSATALSSQARDRLQVMAANQSDPQAQPPAANTELVAADQLNDVDRALSENRNDDKDKAASATLAMAVAQAPAQTQTQAAIVSNDDSAWGQTSLIGKIFIAFGGLLTLASAARMFMA